MTRISEDSRSSTFSTLERRYDLDWLRVVSIFFVFVYHCTNFFDAAPFYIKNNPEEFLNGIIPQNNYQLTANTSYLTALGLPLFFIIAGMSTFYALGVMEKKNIKLRQYISIRFIRLLVPYLIGIFTYVSILVFLEGTNKGDISSSFLEFFPTYFEGIYGFGGNFSAMGHHLWFLVILFIFSLISTPICAYLRRIEFRSQISKVAAFFTKSGMIYLLMIPIYIVEIVHSCFLNDLPRAGGWNFFSYFFFLIFGYLFAYDTQFNTTLKKNMIQNVIIGVLSLVVLILLNKFYFEEIWINSEFEFIIIPFMMIRVIFAWSWLMVILFLGRKYLNKESKAVKTLNELVLPFYILHYVITNIVGFFIVQLDFPVISEFLLILVISLVGIMLLLLLIREFNLFRFIFGMQVSEKKRITRFFKKKKPSTVSLN